MAKPGGNPENLIPNPERSPEELQEMGKAGGIKSGEVRREKKRMADIYAGVLAAKFKVKDDEGKESEISGSEMIGKVVAKIVQREDSSSVSMLKELREGIDGTQIEVEVMDLTKGMTYDQKKKRIEEILARRNGTARD